MQAEIEIETDYFWDLNLQQPRQSCEIEKWMSSEGKRLPESMMVSICHILSSFNDSRMMKFCSLFYTADANLEFAMQNHSLSWSHQEQHRV